MRRFFSRKEEPSPNDKLIAKLQDDMLRMEPDDDNYPIYMGYVERLTEIKGKTRRNPVSKDTMLIVGGNVFIAFLIVAFERSHVMTSKALGLIKMPKNP